MPGWIRLLVRFVTAIWCRSIETTGRQHVPRGVPLIVVANHENGLIDPLLIASGLPVAPRFLAKSTLWKNPVLRFFFGLANVVPVPRKQDAAEGADMKMNVEMFEIAGGVLAKNGVLGHATHRGRLLPIQRNARRQAYFDISLCTHGAGASGDVGK